MKTGSASRWVGRQGSSRRVPFTRCNWDSDRYWPGNFVKVHRDTRRLLPRTESGADAEPGSPVPVFPMR